MSDEMPRDSQLISDLAEYFTITTTTPLPPGVSQMSAATLGPRRRSLKVFMGPAAAVLTGAAAVLVGLTLSHGTPGGASGAGSRSGGGGAAALPYGPMAGSGAASAVAYPGVNAAMLESAGHIRLGSAAGLSGASIPASAAQATARMAEAAQVGATGPAGPAVLAWVEDHGSPPLQCLCWVVDVPVNSGMVGGTAARTVLVFIDASTGRYRGAHVGDGIP